MKNKKGFTLLIAIVTTATLLIVSFVVVNMAFRQLLISDASEESQYAFYNADSGIECVIYWDFRTNIISPFSPVQGGTVTCNGSTLPVTVVSDNITVATTTFTVNLTKGCAIVTVAKGINGNTTVDSRGYNTCAGGAARRFERGIKLSYPSDPLYINPSATTNLVVNSSFETDISSWAQVVMTATRNSTHATPFGSDSVTATFSGTSGAGFRYSLTGITNTKYTLSAFFNTSATTCNLLFVYDTGSGQIGVSAPIPNTQGNWKRVALTFTPSGATGPGYIDVPRCNGFETLEVDGVALINS